MEKCVRCNETKPFTAYRRGANATRICRDCDLLRQRTSYRKHSARRREEGAVYRALAESSAFETRRCVGCDADFRFYKSLGNKRPGAGKFCSVACRKRRTTKTCIKCGAGFDVWPCMAGTRKYCSLRCAGRKSDLVQITCQFCGGKSEPIMPSQAAHRLFCSIQCSDRSRIKPHSAVAVPYTGRAWRATKETILERDGRRCTRCQSGLNLHVHHIVPWSETGDDSPSNLITLCQPCHAAVHYPSKALGARWQAV